MAILTIGLQNLRRQVNAAFPQRDKTSDGWIGDTAHQSTTSGHNPDDKSGSRPAWNGDPDSTQEVRAWDCDSDFGPGVDAQDVVDHLRKLRGLSSVIRYMIYNRRIYHASNGYVSAPYNGSSAHTEHIHFEGAWTQAADNNKSFNYHLEEVPMALTAEDKKWIESVVDKAVERRVGDVVQRWDADGNLVPPTDPNPNITVATALRVIGQTVTRMEQQAAD
jgi:hypothetical protein